VSTFHYGTLIKQARKRLRMTQGELAARWPRDDGGVGVSLGFVQMVEAGKKPVRSERTKRGLCEILGLEPWQLGLSDFDPEDPSWHPRGKRLLDQTLDFAEYTIQRFEAIYRRVPLPVAAADARAVHQLFTFIKDHQPPAVRQEQRFLRLYAQSLILDAVVFIGYERYEQALACFREMYSVAEQLGEATWLAHALVGSGVEYHRAAYFQRQADASTWAATVQEALQHLEGARDYSFQSSRSVAAYVHAYLARVYSALRDRARFERAIGTALRLAPPSYGDGTDFVYHPLSGILAEESFGWLELGYPEKTLALQSTISEQIQRDGNHRLEAWIHVDWARALLMRREVEGSLAEGRLFAERARELASPQMQSRARRLAEELCRHFPDVQAVRQWQEELEEQRREQQRQEEEQEG
jgi:tetratricopeptide (TPR) repeat protein